MKPVSTFSIIGRDPATGDLGVAVASKFLAVGAVVPWLAGGVGAVATQSYANTSFGPRGLAAMEAGEAPEAIAASFEASDEAYHQRQYGLVDALGRAYTFTGDGCHPWAGGRTATGYAAQGNILAGPEVVDAMAEAFEAGGNHPLPERLLQSLLAGDRAGGDRRGRQSAALTVARPGGGYAGLNDRMVDLRVDDHPNPVPELGRLLGIHRLLFERPADTDLVPLEGVTARLRTALARAGEPLSLEGGWDDEAETALRRVAGVENLEERLVGGGRVDRRVLEHLERKYGA